MRAVSVARAQLLCSFCYLLFYFSQIFCSRRDALIFRVTREPAVPPLVNRPVKADHKNSLHLLRLPAILSVPFREVAVASSGGISCGRPWYG